MEESELDLTNEKGQKLGASESQSGELAQVGQRLAEETRRSFESGRERGRLEGRQAEHDARAAELQAIEERHTRQAAELLSSFAQARDQYLQVVEQEVVRLALAIAARILRREAQMDPLLLTGAVRVALGQLSGSTEVKLQVPAAELELWKTAIALIPNLALKPTVIAGEEMRLGDCRIETTQGSVDLGIRSQLGEIERGFFDRSPGSKIKTTDGLESIPAETRP
jgi:flagellar assembly protein FliH